MVTEKDEQTLFDEQALKDNNERVVDDGPDEDELHQRANDLEKAHGIGESLSVDDACGTLRAAAAREHARSRRGAGAAVVLHGQQPVKMGEQFRWIGGLYPGEVGTVVEQAIGREEGSVSWLQTGEDRSMFFDRVLLDEMVFARVPPAVTIDAPTSQPFAIVGTEEAREAIEKFREDAVELAGTGQNYEGQTELAQTERGLGIRADVLLDVVRHRDALLHERGLLQGLLRAGETSFAMARRILPPSGLPFRFVSTEVGKATIAAVAAGTLGAGALLDLLAHRDHLAAQATELQASNSALLDRERQAKADALKLAVALDHMDDEYCIPVEDDMRAIVARVLVAGGATPRVLETSLLAAKEPRVANAGPVDPKDAEIKRLRHAIKSAREMIRIEDSDDNHEAATFLDEAMATDPPETLRGGKAVPDKRIEKGSAPAEGAATIARWSRGEP